MPEEDIFKETPLVDEEEEEEEEDDEEDEELNAFEKENEDNVEDEIEDDDDEDDEEEDADEDEEDEENENEGENEGENDGENYDEIDGENDGENDADNDGGDNDGDDGDDGDDGGVEENEPLVVQSEDIDRDDDKPIEVGEDTPMTDASDESNPKTKLSEAEKQQKKYYDTLYVKARISESFDIVPVAAIPYACGINAIHLPRSSKWFFTGGDDGYIRKYDFFCTIDGEIQLTAAQKHSVVDSVSNAGSLIAYWENEIPTKRSLVSKEFYQPKLSPVFSLAVEDKCLWLLSGLSDGGINLQSIRQNEGSTVHHFKEHSETVSVLKLNESQDKFLSGSWDKIVNRYDLNTGEVTERFTDGTGQISSLEYRPVGGISIDQVQQPNEDDDDDMGSLFGDEEQPQPSQPQPQQSQSQPIQRQPSQSQTKNTAITGTDDNIFLSSSIDGSLNIWDVRVGKSVIRLKTPKGTPPWCVSACWSADGDSIFAGRRNSTVEEFSLKMPFKSSGDPTPSRVLKFPQVSGAVSVVHVLPNNQHVLCGSQDNIRIYDLNVHSEAHKKTPFLIVPGHHGGVLSDVLFDPTYRYMVSASGNRGWHGTSTETVLFYDVGME